MKPIHLIILSALIYLCSCNRDQPRTYKAVYRERSVINEGDSVMLTGGTHGFLAHAFGCDTCPVKVENTIYIKDIYGLNGSFLICHSDSVQYYSVTLFYRNSKEGYDPARLIRYHEDPFVLDKEIDEWDGQAPRTLDLYNEIVDDSIILIKR